MKKTWFMILALASIGVQADTKGRLSLEAYLEQVKSLNPEVRAAKDAVDAARLKLEEADGPFSPEGYAEYRMFDDKREANSGFAPNRTQNHSWKIGVRDQSSFGLSTDVYVLTGRTQLAGISPQVPIIKDFYSSSVGLELRQTLLRDSFGVATRAELEARRAVSRGDLLRQKLVYKNLLLKAENTYWSLASYNEIVKLQEENVERARRLRDRMKQQAKLRLYDEVDAMQAQASFESRELELQASQDERAGLIRQFNTLRGNSEDRVEGLSDLPTSEFMLKHENNRAKPMSREDFRIAFEQGEALGGQAQGAISRLYPQLDLVASVSSNGLETDSIASREEAQDLRNPTWAVGVIFSIPLDVSLLGDMARSYRAQKRSAAEQKQAAVFNEQRVWDDLVKQKTEVQGRFQRALSLEKLQTELVKKERQRLINGRTTTFQAITFEQNLALSQIARVRAQLGLLQIHNVIKTFEEQL